MISYPFDSEITGYNADGSPIYDRAADSTVLASMMHRFFGDGLIRDDDGVLGFEVSQVGGMSVQISPGYAMIQGRCGDEREQRVLTLGNADGSMNRIDTVVLRRNLDNAYRNIDLYIVTGEAAQSPVPPALTRNETVWELGIANVYIAAGVTQISQPNITDTRLDSNRCGICEIPMKVFNTTALYQQIQADLELRRAESMQYVNQWMELTQNTLNESTEGVLLNEIKANTYQTYAHSKVENVHNLSLSSGVPNIRFVATADFETGDTFVINGTAIDKACMMNGTSLLSGFFVSGAVVTCYWLENKLYFIGTNHSYISFTLLTSGWVQEEDGRITQEIAIDGVLASDRGYADVDMSGATAETARDMLGAWALIDDIETVDGGVRAICFGDVPLVDVPVVIEVIR